MTKPTTKPRNGHLKTLNASVKGRNDKKGKGDDSKDKTVDMNSANTKAKAKNGALLKQGMAKEV